MPRAESQAAARHRILHMSSFSRCGETLLLRCLDAHPDLHVVHQILAPDRPEDFALFRRLRTWPHKEIPHDDDRVQATAAEPHQALVLKNAVWEHSYPYEGFVLVRNPFSVARSFGIHDESSAAFVRHKQQFFRWAAGIDLQLVETMKDPDNLACLCMLYNRKLSPLSRLGLPVVHYELFVQHPEATLRWLLGRLGLEWSPEVMRSHEAYEEGQLGHGRIPLWKPVHTGSLHSYRKLPEEVRRRIYALTYPTLEAFGYTYDGETLDVRREHYDEVLSQS